MKSLKEFLDNKEVTTSKIVEDSFILETTDNPLFENEEEGNQNHHNPMDPPAILIMRRKYIRQYPNNQRVAMYYVDKINKYVTVPYTAMQWTSSTPEEFSAIGQLDQIVENKKSDFVLLKDGEKLAVTVQVAESVLKMYSELNEENKVKLSEMANTSKEQFSRVVDFANKHLK